jgi:hypothetical protein
MSSTNPKDQNALLHNAPKAPPRQPRPGEEVWRLQGGAHLVVCELRNDSSAGLGWDVQILQDGELLHSQRAIHEDGARFTAECFREDYMRAGFGR